MISFRDYLIHVEARPDGYLARYCRHDTPERVYIRRGATAEEATRAAIRHIQADLPYICPECGGRGEIAWSPSGNLNDPRTDYYRCHHCDGTGEVL